jgi:DNA-binding MarR family transcriptional regulator
MNVLLQALERDGYVERSSEPSAGKVLPTRLTPAGRRSLETASRAVREVELRMLGRLTEADQADARRILRSMIGALRENPTHR